MAEKYTLTQGAAQWLVEKVKGSHSNTYIITVPVPLHLGQPAALEQSWCTI